MALPRAAAAPAGPATTKNAKLQFEVIVWRLARLLNAR